MDRGLLCLSLLLPACVYITDAHEASRLDPDQDGVPWPEDCDSEDASVTAGAPAWADRDGDGFGDEANPQEFCALPEGWSRLGGDCDDDDSAINPDADEVCGDGVDNNCNQQRDGCSPEGSLGVDSASSRLEGADPADGAGWRVVGGGDVDGDRRPDLLIGAPRAPGVARRDTGVIYVLTNLRAGSAALDDAATATVLGLSQDGQFGWAAALGDLDGDGYADAIGGAPTSDDRAGGQEGRAVVFLGPIDGDFPLTEADLSVIGAVERERLGAAVMPLPDGGDGVDYVAVGADQVGADGVSARGAVYLFGDARRGALLRDSTDADAAWLGANAGDGAGAELAALGDVDGDGREDALVGAPDGEVGGSAVGFAALVMGPLAEDRLLDLDGAVLLAGRAAGARAGSALAGPGDLNGDGLADLTVGAEEDGDKGSGAAFVVLGASGLDGLRPLSEADVVLSGEGGEAAGSSVAGPGDVDGDGVLDLLVGARDASEGDGAVYLLYGPLSGSIALADAAASLHAPHEAGALGHALGRAGDLNADGYDDLLIGAPEYGAAEAGAAFVFLGGGL